MKIARAYNKLHEQYLEALKGNEKLSAMYAALHIKHVALEEAHRKEMADLKAENAKLRSAN
jgi:hypothetical protein